MAQRTVIVDASVLIHLGGVGQLGILSALFGRVTVPPVVSVEATQRGAQLPEWVDVRPLGDAMDARVIAARLDAGESEVLCLGLELPDALLVLDDGAARDLAVDLGLRITGTAALLVRAKQAGLIPKVRPVLDALLVGSFRLSAKVYETILKAAGEAPKDTP